MVALAIKGRLGAEGLSRLTRGERRAAPSVPCAAAAPPLRLPILMAIDEGKIEPSSFAKGINVHDHPSISVYGETHIVARLQSLQQCRGSDHEAHFHHRRHEALDLLVGKD